MSIVNELSSSVGDLTQSANQAVAEKVQANLALLDEIANSFTASDPKLVGDCVEVFTMVAEKQPQAVAPYVDKLLPLLQAKNTRIRWEAMHTLAFVARYVPDTMAQLAPELMKVVAHDQSIIVRNYALEAIGEYAATSADAAEAVFPCLVESLTLWEGRHVDISLEALAKSAMVDPGLVPQVVEIVESYQYDEVTRLRRVSKSILKKLGQKS